MVTPASLQRISGPIACLALLLSSLPASAQAVNKPADSKVQSEEAIFLPVEYRPLAYQVSVGFRISGNAKVKFSELGARPPSSKPGPATGVQDRTYDNGFVAADKSLDAEGNPIPSPVGSTNVWGYANSNQLDNPLVPNATSVAFQSNSIESLGTSASASSGSSSAWDIEISRRLGGNKRISWGITFGAGLSDFNAKTAGTIKSNLRTITDTYALSSNSEALISTDIYGNQLYASSYQAAGTTPYGVTVDVVTEVQAVDANNVGLLNADDTPQMVSITTPTAVLNPDGTQKLAWREPARLGNEPVRTTTVAEIDVTGNWQVKGAFITSRFGPYVACQLGRYFALRASAGVTFTVMGAQLRFHENAYHVYLATDMPTDVGENSTDHTVAGTLGYFISGELDWFMTRRTGLYVGAIHESYARDLKITLPGLSQTADIAANAGTAFRAGITTSF